MSDNVRNLKSSLFKSLRLFFWSNVAFALVFSCCLFYYRSRVKSLENSVRFLAASSVALLSSYSSSVDFLTNQYFRASSAFASNVLVTAFGSSTNSASSSPFLPVVIDDPPSADSLPIQFNGYFEINGHSYIRVRSKYYKVGDMLLGFPIVSISPDVVEYRGRYWKVDQDSERKN